MGAVWGHHHALKPQRKAQRRTHLPGDKLYSATAIFPPNDGFGSVCHFADRQKADIRDPAWNPRETGGE
jgi:hypothetical protein